VDDETLGRNAGLTAVHRAGFDTGLHGLVEIGTGHHDERIASAELQDDLLDLVARFRGDALSGGFTSGQRGGRDACVLKNRMNPGRTDQKRLKHPLGESGLAENFLDRQGTLRHVGRVLEQTNISGHQCRGRKTEHLPEREVPRHDRQNHAQGLVMDVGARCIRSNVLVG
jgi:hypothetical protein